MIRALVLLIMLVGACDRFVNLSPPPDAHTDAAHDGFLPDAQTVQDSAAISDAFIPPD